MKPVLRKSLPGIESSFVVRQDMGSQMKNKWHYHEECELLYIKKSAGIWFIGDYVGEFKSGDIILLGSCLPHSFLHEEQYTEANGYGGQAGVVLFSPDILGDTFLSMPEVGSIRNVLQLSGRGLKMMGATRARLADIMNDLPEVGKGKRLIDLLTMLVLIGENHEYEFLASSGYATVTEEVSNERLLRVIEYTHQNYSETIRLEDVAALVNMSTHSFCRFFKKKTGQTYIQFLMEVRIGQACKLLIEHDLNPSEVGYSCGYNSVSHFNHQFKLIKKQSPSVFKQNFLVLKS